jgi:hypothetical protein
MNKNEEHRFAAAITPILNELEDAMWEFEVNNVGIKPNFNDSALRSASKIFMAIMLDKMYNLQDVEKMNLEDRCNMANKLGEEIRKIVKIYTNQDTFDFYK